MHIEPSSVAHHSDGRGLEADQKVIAAHGCYAMTATTALTAQNTLRVDGIHEVPSEFVARQIDACATDLGIDVVKTGNDTLTISILLDHKPLVSRLLADI